MQITKSYNSLCIKHEWKETSSYKSIQFHRKRPSQAPHVLCVLSLHSSVVWARSKRELLLLAVFCDWPCRVTPYFHVRCEQTNCMWAESLLLESNRWLNITIGLFRDESGFVLLHCGEQTLMEVILTNIKLIPDTLAHQHQLFVCHCGEHCARLLSHADADRVCLHVSVIAGEQPYHFYVSSGLDVLFTDAQNSAWRNPFCVWKAATSFFFKHV